MPLNYDLGQLKTFNQPYSPGDSGLIINRALFVYRKQIKTISCAWHLPRGVGAVGPAIAVFGDGVVYCCADFWPLSPDSVTL